MGSKGTNTSTQSTAPPKEVMAQYQALLGKANNVAGQNTVSPLTSNQQGAFSAFGSIPGMYRPQTEALAAAGSGGINAGQIANYSNPYQQQVIDATMANINENDARQQAQLKGNAIAQGALGGDREGVAAAELARQQGLARNQTYAGLNASNYSQALAAAQADREAAARGAGIYSGLESNALQGAAAQMQAGETEQQYYDRILSQPYDQLGWLARIQSSLAPGMGSTTTQTTPAPGLLQQIAGLGLAGAGLAGGLGWKPFGAAAGGAVPGRAEGGPPPQAGIGITKRVHEMMSDALHMAQMIKSAQGGAVPDLGGNSGGMAPLSFSGGGMHMYEHPPEAMPQPEPVAMQPAMAGIGAPGRAEGGFNFPMAWEPSYMGIPQPYGGIGAQAPLPHIPNADKYGRISMPSQPSMLGEALTANAPGPAIEAADPAVEVLERGTGRSINAPVVAPKAVDRVSQAPGIAPIGASETPVIQTVDGQPLDVTGLSERIEGAPAPVTRGIGSGSSGSSSDPSTPAAPLPSGLGAVGDDLAAAGNPGTQAGVAATLAKAKADGAPEWALPVMMAGLGMLASTSPNFGVALGQGGIQGVKTLMDQRAAAAKQGNENRDFDLREKALDIQSKQLAESLAQHKEAAGIQREEMDLRKATTNMPPGWRVNKEGVGERVEGVPDSKSLVLTQPAINSLSNAGESFVNMSRVGSTFKDDYTGPGGPWVGNTANWVAKFTGLGNTEAADWWADYNAQANVARKALFGSAFTKQEKQAWDAASIQPGMTADLIRSNLQRQQDAATRAAAKLAQVHIGQGKSPQVVADAMGVSIDDLNEAGGAQAGRGERSATDAAKPTTAAGPKVGAIEKGYRFKGGDPSKKENWEPVQ